MDNRSSMNAFEAFNKGVEINIKGRGYRNNSQRLKNRAKI